MASLVKKKRTCLTRYRVEQKIKFVSTRGHVISLIYKIPLPEKAKARLNAPISSARCSRGGFVLSFVSFQSKKKTSIAMGMSSRTLVH